MYFTVLLVSILVVQAHAQVSPSEGSVKKNDNQSTTSRRTSPFRYVIVSGVSEIEKYVNENPQLTYLEVLMEDGAFNESNLRLLFKLLSERFNEKPGLGVDVYTSLDAILTPEENDRLPLKGPPEGYDKYKYAFYTRNGFGEYFEFGIPNKIIRKKVIMKPAPDNWPGIKK